ncbi:ABC transporter ATP-binding protein [Lachnoclostridium sp. MSJ-17]|uniref:ABC transporter ATP-binding protein n=1 Tax=Lachnoclostridium sp. MSJ-17 TaxID=2841516 RepID=UPI001C115529|nr:ABC transporter ATP-binding protein [Lachnoclostridium sp. MSJ-17]
MEQTSKKVIVSLKDIFVRFDGEVILNHINLDIHEKEFVTILGPSGCGKTTTLRIIGGFVEPESGDVIFDGNRINGLPPHKRNVNTVFQKYSLFPHLNVYDNVAFGLKLKKLPKNEIKQKVTKMLAVVDLKGYEKRPVQKLSGGQQQRVAIARALVCDPDIILLDEPLGALDLKLRKDMQLELKEIQKNTQKTFIYVTHDQEEALTMSDRVVVMNNGVIEQIGTPEDIYNEPVNAFVADFIGEANILNGTMIDDCRIRILGKELECVDKGFGKNTPVDVVIRPEDIIITPPEKGQLTGVVEKLTFKGVHYEMSIRCGRCEILVHSTRSAEVGTTVGMSVVPFNIQIMNKLLPFYDNIIETSVVSSDEAENYFEFELEGETIKVDGHFFPEETRLRITLPPSALSLAGDGTGDLQDVYIESVVYKGEHNEIILESDERKWLMLSDTDEQVATYVPLSFDFTKAQFEVLDPEPAEGEAER